MAQEYEWLSRIDTTQVTGYAADDRFLASRYTQGGRTVYDFELSLELIPAILPVPDPHRPTQGNRRVNMKHASDFGVYVRQHDEWVAPGLLLRAPDIFGFEVLTDAGGVAFGVLSIPRSARSEIRILDGQHRILGLALALDDIGRELDDARSHAAKAARKGKANLVANFEHDIQRLERQQQRLSIERLAVQIHVETDPDRYQQMFFDVAENALGITSAVKVRFDSRKIVNRTLDAMARHALLEGRVDLEQDRVVGSNPNLLGAKHVVELVRTVAVGINGRISKRLENELDEGALIEDTNAFLDALLIAFPDLQRVADGLLGPEQLRKSSLLGSTTMLRVLAGVFHRLRNLGWDDEEITDFLSRLAPHMKAPITARSPWLKIQTPVFKEEALAPTARSQDLRHLTEEIASWIDRPPRWLG